MTSTSRSSTERPAHAANCESTGRDLEREVLPLLHDQNVGLMVWSPLAGGLLTGKFERDGDGPADSRRANFDFPPVNKERAFDIIDVLEPMAAERDVSIARLALAWLLHQPVHQPGVTSVIIGAKKMHQLEDNLQAIDVTFTEEELRQIDEVSALEPEYPQWMIEFQGDGRSPEDEDRLDDDA